MKFSKKILWRLKKKNKKLRPDMYKRLKRKNLRGSIKGKINRPRLSVYRSKQNIYAQIIDDCNAKTLISCSSLDRSIKVKIKNGRTCETARLIGQKLAQLSLKKNITQIVFDRGPYIYHGRIKALAEGARSAGLKF